VVGRENVIAGTDCGFSQGWNMIRVHPEVQWAKLTALAEGAALASKKLWKSIDLAAGPKTSRRRRIGRKKRRAALKTSSYTVRARVPEGG